MTTETTSTDTPTDTAPADGVVVDVPGNSAPDGVDDVAADPSAADDATLLGGDEAKPDGEGEKGEAGEVEGAPEAYELALKNEAGEDVPLDPEMVTAATEVFRELNLTNEQANKLVPMAQIAMNKGRDATMAFLNDAGAQQKKVWLDEFKAHPDLGGVNEEKTLHLAAVALDKLGIPKGHEFREALDATGLGNNVHMVRAFAKLGELLGEDTDFPTPNGAGGKETVGWADRYKT